MKADLKIAINDVRIPHHQRALDGTEVESEWRVECCGVEDVCEANTGEGFKNPIRAKL